MTLRSFLLLGVLCLVAAPARAQVDAGVPNDAAPSDAGARDDDAIADSESESDSDSDSEADSDSESESGSDSDSESDSESDSAVEAEAEAEESSSRSSHIQYTIERVVVRGNGRTDTGVILAYVPLHRGDTLDVDDPRVEAIRWQLLGTGWFDEVRLELERGSRRGRVVVVVQVSERNTFVVQSLALGVSEGLFQSDSPDTELQPYFGISVAEQNLFGTGVSVEATGLVSVPQQGVRLRAGQASVLGGDWGLTGELFFNNGREFFGNDDVVIALDDCPMREPPDDMRCEESRNAVVVYRRFGASLGTGTDLGPSWRFTLDWRFEAVELVDRPAAASHRRGTEIRPIDFHIHDGWSFVSLVQLGLVHDERDNPGLTTEGRLVFIEGDLSTQLFGSSYDFVRVQAGWREWFRLPEAHHALRLGLFVGAAVGDTPFFYRFYLGDLSDLIPARVLQLNLDRRAPPNLLGTSIQEMRAQELSGRADVEYSLWLFESRDEVRGLVLYGNVGVYTLFDRQDLVTGIPGYSGFAAAPIDLTFDVGLRLDTVVGVFSLGLSTLLGFISL
ncbi:MAG: BamA/TamA family outer membrane protein [Sandaracinaceae bacterium]